MKFMGYTRPDGSVGVRNYLLILSVVSCANSTARKIAAAFPDAALITPAGGCAHLPDEAALVLKTLAGHALNPNVGAVLVVGLGCENISADAIVQQVKAAGKPADSVIIQETGGTRATVAAGREKARTLLRQIAELKREPHDLSELVIGLECGGSDAASGISANPALGLCSDRLVALGATTILAEMAELIGAEQILARRAATPQVAKEILQLVHCAEDLFLSRGFDIRSTNPSPGNKTGGLTTLEEKSLGAAHKAGTSPIVETVGYGERPTKKGLIIMDTPAADVESVGGMVAGGAQIVVFTTGRGNPIGSPVAPVIKVVSNSETARRMPENIDVNAGTILDGTQTMAEVAEKILQAILHAANGEPVAAEREGCAEFALYRFQPTQ